MDPVTDAVIAGLLGALLTLGVWMLSGHPGWHDPTGTYNCGGLRR